jgi:hypothetical protein
MSRARWKWRLPRRLTKWFSGHRAEDHAAASGIGPPDRGQLFEGHFWLPGRESSRQAGVLRAGPGQAPEIAVLGPLLSPWRETGRAELPDGRTKVTAHGAEEDFTAPVTVHGVDDRGKPLTLISARTVYWGPPDATGYTHRFRGIQAVVGGHVRDRDHQFTGFRVRLRNVEAWRQSLQQAQWTTPVPLADGGSITIEELPASGHGDRSDLWLTGRALPPATLRGIEARFVRPLVSLFTLATDRLCSPLAMQVQEESPDGPWWDLHSAALLADGDNDGLLWDMPRWLLQPPDFGLLQVGLWLDEASLLGPLPAVVTDLAQAPAISLDTQALLLATVAEGLHRRLYPEDRRFDENAEVNAGVAARVQAAGAEAAGLVHPDAKAAVDGLLRHVGDPGYPGRLKRLAAVAEVAAPGITGKTPRWKTLVSDIRNEYAHRIGKGFLDDRDIDNRLTVVFSLRWLLTVVLLLHSGIDAPVLRARLATHENYQRFLADAQVRCPRIYPPPA